MKSISLTAAAAAFAIVALLFAGSASAQATRTWVSGVGDDANPCSRTAPCKTFAGAISKTAASGEINCLDPGGFGAVTITKALTIDCQNLSNGGVLVAGTNGIVVSAGPTDDVQLIGLDIDGIGPTGGSLNGVKMLSGGSLAIINCVIYGFQNNNGTDGAGVLVNAADGAHVEIANTILRSNTSGVSVIPQASATNGVLIEHSLIDRNAVASVSLSGPGAVVVLSGDSLMSSPTSISNPGGGQVISYGNNMIRNGGSPTSTLPLQ